MDRRKEVRSSRVRVRARPKTQRLRRHRHTSKDTHSPPENPDASKATSSPSMGMPTFSGSESDGSVAAAAAVAAKGAVVVAVEGTFFFFSVLGEAITVWCASTWTFSAGGNGAAGEAADDVPSPPPCTAGGASWSSMVALAPLEYTTAFAGVCSFSGWTDTWHDEKGTFEGKETSCAVPAFYMYRATDGSFSD